MARRPKDQPERPMLGVDPAEVDARREAFVKAYLANGKNGSAAAREVGFAPSVAGTISLIYRKRDPISMAMIKAHREKVAKQLDERLELSVERVIEELRRVVTFDPRRLYNQDGTLRPITSLEPEVAAMIAGVEVVERTVPLPGGKSRVTVETKKIKLWDKRAALADAMRHLGLFEKDNKQKSTEVHLHVTQEDAGVL